MALFGEKKQRTYCHRCGDRVKKLNYRGQILRSKYCGRCFCKKIEDGRTCQWPRVNLVIPWCAERKQYLIISAFLSFSTLSG
jgi:hypothetical protein